MTRRPLVLPVLLMLAACAESSETVVPTNAAFTVSTDTVNGTPVVTNRGDAPRWTLDTLASFGEVGGMEEASPEEFARVSSTMLVGDSLFVADIFASEIRVFDVSSGDHITTSGRTGEGPGEFGQLISLAKLGDRFLALDFGNGRIGELDFRGDWIGQREAPGRISGSPAMLRFHPLGDSLAVAWSIGADESGDFQRWWVDHGLEGELLRVVQHTGEYPDAPETVRCDHAAAGSIHFFDSPFGGAAVTLPAGGGRQWTGHGLSYRLSLLDADGDTLRTVVRERAPVPISDAEWDEETRPFREFMDEASGVDCEPRSLTRLDAKAAFTNAFIDTDHRLWIEAWIEGGTEWDVFSPEGELIATLPGFDYSDRTVPLVTGDRIVWVSTDELDTQRVHVGRLR